MPASTRRTTLGAIHMNRTRESIPGSTASASTSNENNNSSITQNQNGKMKKKSTRSRMSMAPRVGGSSNTEMDTVKSTNNHSIGHEKKQKGFGGGGGANSNSSSAVPTPTTPSRRKSMGHGLTQSTSNAIRADPRPINDKNYQNKCIRTIINYLLESGYDHPVSHKMLTRPSGKDFSQIVTFLLRQVDPAFNDHTMKFEDEVALTFKTLGYPFPISKTALVAAGSIHTWPTLLAALTWLIELLSCFSVTKDEMEDDDSDNETDHQGGATDTIQQPLGNLDTLLIKTEKRFFRYLAQSYEAFLSSNDDQYDILEEQFLDDFERDNMKIEKEIERLTDCNASIVAEMDDLAENSLTLPELEKKREDLCTDLEKFHSLVHKFNEHKAALEQKVNDRNLEYKETEEQLHTTRNRVKELKQQIETQEFSVEDVRKMEDECTRIQEIMERSGKDKQTNQKKVWECEMELKKEFEQLDSIVKRYNDLAKELLKDDFFYILVHEELVDERSQSKFLGVDVKNSVIPMLLKLKNDYIQKISQAGNKRSELMEEIKNREKTINELNESVKVREEENTKIQNVFKDEEQQLESNLTAIRKQIESIENKTKSLRDPIALEASIERFHTQAVQLARRREQQKQEGAEQIEAFHKEINDALSMIADHKDYVQTKLAELEEYLNHKSMSLEMQFTTDLELK